MKRQIRKNVFETNSSSTHAICISKENVYNKEDYVSFGIGEFGWKFAVYKDTDDKASYLITAILGRSKEYADEKLARLKQLLEENNIEYTLPELEEKSWEYNGQIHNYYEIDGYIDHAGETEEFVEAVLSDSESLMKYLFGDSFIVTGNDNSPEPYDDYFFNYEDEEVTNYGTYKRYSDEYKEEFNKYEIYEKGN